MILRRLLKKLALSLLATLLLLYALELVARAGEPGSFSFFDRRPYLDHPSLHHVHRPGFHGHWDSSEYLINSLGMRGPELAVPKQSGELRVVALGDSCTFGKGVEERDSWPRQLERQLTLRYPDRLVTVANMGVNGYSGKDYAELFASRGEQLDADLVLVGYNLNDFPNAIRATDEAVYKQGLLRDLLSQRTREFLGRFAGYRWLRAEWYDQRRESYWKEAEDFARGSDPGGDGAQHEVWLQQSLYLQSIQKGAAAHGGRLAVFLFPYESQVYLESYDQTPIRLMSELCSGLGIPFVSMAESFRAAAHETEPPRELFLKGDRYHPTAEGYALVVKQVLKLLEANALLPEEPQ